MQYIKGIEPYQNERRSAITLGKFDGLHLGHEELIGRIVEHQKNDNVDSIVFAFDMSPLYKKRNEQHSILLTNEERAKRLEGRVDYLVECAFVDSISGMEAEVFIEQILVKKFHVKYIVVGTDFHFGYQKRGDWKMLQEYSKAYGYHVEVVEKRCYMGREISSTYIKEEIQKGNIVLANMLLGYSYTVCGQVIYGKQLGRKLGFPTMNIRPSKNKLLPPNGVYVSKTCVSGKWYESVCNIGVKPTVTSDDDALLETHLLHYDSDAYGENIAVSLYDYRRAEKKFGSVDMLQKAMEEDIVYSKKYFDSKANL